MSDSDSTTDRETSDRAEKIEEKRVRFSRNLLGFLRHPLLILMVTTVVSSWVIPKIAYQSKVQEERLNKALEILNHSTNIERHINVMLTTLEIFHKDNVGAAAHLLDYREEQRILREEMRKRYIEFDREAWWWYRDVPSNSVLLQLTSRDEAERMQEILDNYEKNLVDTTHALDNLWNALLREEYDPSDDYNMTIARDTRQRITELGHSRRELTASLAEIIVSN